jgi:hypothetical protein
MAYIIISHQSYPVNNYFPELEGGDDVWVARGYVLYTLVQKYINVRRCTFATSDMVNVMVKVGSMVKVKVKVKEIVLNLNDL